ncbi:MAG: M20/M25/M40 family metallo-hydrolase [Acidobacteria bacterium]|nr:M20/M25/M40 family metallo-hydrolase [Acidobacteriota bacterium]
MKRMICLGFLNLLLTTTLNAQTAPDFAKAKDEAVKRLQEMIRIDTSNPPGNETKLAQYLKALLDKEGIASEILEKEPGRGNLLARINGNGSKKPLLLMGHADVVGVEREKWTVPPFDGIIKDGYVYGRGAYDDKGGITSMLQVFLMLHRQKIPLDRDIIFLAEAGEEAGGGVGIEFLIESHWPKIEAEFALNEGAEILMKDGKVRYVGVATSEKLVRRIKLTARGISGHGSMPRVDNPIVHLAAAVQKIGTYQPPLRFNDITKTFFERLARVSPPEEAYIYSHLDDPVVGSMAQEKLRHTNTLYNSMLRTSIAPTMIKGGFRENVIPADAEVIVDVRALPDENMPAFIENLRRMIDDPAVEITPIGDHTTVTPPSRIDTDLFRALEKAQATVFPGAVTLPMMLTGGTDSAPLRLKGVQAYGIDPVVSEEEIARMHGNDERVPIEGIGKFVEILYRAVVEVAGKQ